MGTNGNQLLLVKQAAILEKHYDTELTYILTPIELWTLHGLVRLAADHPRVKELSEYTQGVIRRFREFCKDTWIEQGLTPEEARTLDELGQ